MQNLRAMKSTNLEMTICENSQTYPSPILVPYDCQDFQASDFQ